VFDRHFEAFLADSPAGRDLHFRLRYDVYCRETGWEDPLRFPDLKERDEHDESAVAFLVRRKKTFDWVATMRLVLGRIEQLPISRHVPLQLDRLPSASRGRIGEFSRLCLVGKYRRQARSASEEPGPTLELDDSFLQSSYRLSESWIMLGLIRAAHAYSRMQGIDYWIFLVAESLARIIHRSGLDIEPVGPPVEHRGLRRPYLLDLVKGVAAMPVRAPRVHEMFFERPAYRAFSELQEPLLPRNGPRPQPQ
jgi:N-acyl amino acid synthase of PEP-CTERM/exosortase system